MRELKFRAWNTKKNKYIEPKNLVNLCGETTKELKEMAPHLTLEQFTGLLDKNGKEIFEGDILRFPPKDEYEKHTFNSFEVFWHDNDCADNHIGWQMDRMHTHGNSCGGTHLYKMLPKHTSKLEIIGNIHDKE